MSENISTEERIAKLESENVTLFHYIKEIKDEQKEFRKLVAAVEKIANQTADNREMLEQNNNKLDDISARLTSAGRISQEKSRQNIGHSCCGRCDRNCERNNYGFNYILNQIRRNHYEENQS